MVQISEVKGNKRDNRTAAHTHIRGLGLKSDGFAEKNAAGFVGQVPAREVLMTHSFFYTLLFEGPVMGLTNVSSSSSSSVNSRAASWSI